MYVMDKQSPKVCRRGSGMPKIIVISAYHNRANFVDETMRGLIEQIYLDFKAVVVDDGSRDETYANLCRHKCERICVKRQKNTGFVAALSSIISSTDSQYIAIHGSGDYSYPNRLTLQAGYLDAHPAVVAVGCYSEIVSLVSDYRAIHRPQIEEDIHAQLIRANPLGHGQVMMRRSIYDAVGGYRRFFIYRQDLDLWFRMSEKGRLAVVPHVLYRQYTLPGSVSQNPTKYTLGIICREFAIHCASERRRGRPDPLESMGPVAALARPRSVRVSQQLAYAARRRAVRGFGEDARYFATASINENLTVSGIATQLIVRMPGLVGLRRVVVCSRKLGRRALASARLQVRFFRGRQAKLQSKRLGRRVAGVVVRSTYTPPEDSAAGGGTLRRRVTSEVMVTSTLHAAGLTSDLLFTAILARLLIPADYGIVAAATVFIAFCKLLREVGIGAAIIQLPTLTIDDQRTGASLVMVISVLICAMAQLVAPFFATLMSLQAAEPVLRALSLIIVI